MLDDSRRKTKHRPQSGEPSTPRSIMLGLFWTCVLSLILLVLFSAIVYSTPDPGSLVLPTALAAAYLSAFFGGFAAAWLNRGDPLPCGLMTGGAFFVVMLLLSLVIPGGAESKVGFWTSAGLHALIILFSLLGAFAGTSLRESGRHKRHKKR